MLAQGAAGVWTERGTSHVRWEGECGGALESLPFAFACWTRGTQVRKMEANSYKKDLHMECSRLRVVLKRKVSSMWFFFFKADFLFTY